MFNLSTYTDYLAACSATVFGKVARSILAGSIGVVVLVFFLTLVVQPNTISKLLPFIVAFNTALAGYMVLDITRDRIKHRRTASIVSGSAALLLAALAVNLIFIQVSGYALISFEELPFLLLVSILSGGLGGMLAIKYFTLNPQH